MPDRTATISNSASWYDLERGLANYGLWPHAAHCLVLSIKFYWNNDVYLFPHCVWLLLRCNRIVE